MIGDMTESVRLVRRARVQRADGGYDVSDTTLADVWAAVRPVEARETEQGGRLFGSTSYLIVLHADDLPAGLTTDDHAVWAAPDGDVSFNIRAIRRSRDRELTVELVGEKGAAL
jgi:head-tail adaptor